LTSIEDERNVVTMAPEFTIEQAVDFSIANELECCPMDYDKALSMFLARWKGYADEHGYSEEDFAAELP